VKSADEVTWYAFLAMKKKAKYRIRNWSEYNASHKKRGSGAIWVSSEAVENWTTDELTGQWSLLPLITASLLWGQDGSREGGCKSFLLYW
jgi:hypothetical protein